VGQFLSGYKALVMLNCTGKIKIDSLSVTFMRSITFSFLVLDRDKIAEFCVCFSLSVHYKNPCYLL
jgi:hypothetical protein